jgi:hypothetical protein
MNAQEPVFPNPQLDRAWGLTVRDYVAIACLPIVDRKEPHNDAVSHESAIAFRAYRLADALIAASQTPAKESGK